MLERLGEVSLVSGDKMTVMLVTPPEWEYAEKVGRFLDHKSDTSGRGIRQRLRGDYSTYCTDKYFIGEIDGHIAGQLWYGYSESGIGNFGHVYTAPEHRKKGVTNALLPFFLESFNAAPVKAVMCGTGTPWVAEIYIKFGFQRVYSDPGSGALILLKKEWGKNFEEFYKWYFPKGKSISVVTGSMKYRHDADLMLSHALQMRRRVSRRVGMSSIIRSCEDALHRAEDGQGVVTAAVTGEGHVAGWAFCLNTGSSQEIGSKIFDYEFNPDYSESESSFMSGTLELIRKRGVGRMYAYLSEADTLKMSCLEKEGFHVVARLEKYLSNEEGSRDLVVLSTDAGATEKSSDTLSIRGEHLSNLRNYVVDKVRMPHESYGVEFQRAHDAFLSGIVEKPERKVRLIADVDTLCGTCAKREEEKCRAAKLSSKDRAVAALFGLTAGCTYTAAELVDAVSKPSGSLKETVNAIVKAIGL